MGIFSKKQTPQIDPEQKELIENAQARVRQKKKLYRHFIIFLAGAILMIVMNLGLGFGKDVTLFEKDWFIWAILLWTFFFLVHLINVFLLGSFMNKQWEKEQVEKLVEKQKVTIARLQEEVDAQMPLPEKKTPLPSSQTAATIDPNSPL